MSRKGGRPPHEPTNDTRKYVDALASFGVPQEKIAAVMEIDEKTLRKHYATQLATASIKANALVAQSLFKTATAGKGKEAVTAAIFWMKTRAGWTEKSITELTGKDGAPIQTEDVTPLDVRKVSKEERAMLRRLLEAQVAGKKEPEKV